MATVYSCIYPSGYTLSTAETALYGTRTYTGFSAWITGRVRDLQTAGDSEVCHVLDGDGGWDGSTDTLTAIGDLTSTWNTDEDHTLTIEVIGASVVDGVWDATKYVLESTSNYITCIKIQTPYVAIYGMQILGNNSTYGETSGIDVKSHECRIERCFVDKMPYYGIASDSSSLGLVISNTKVTNSYRSGIYASNLNTYKNCLVDSNNRANSSDNAGIRCSYVGALTLENCLITNNGNADILRTGSTGDTGLIYNTITSDGTATTAGKGSGNLANQTNATLYKDYSTGDLTHATGSPAIDGGRVNSLTEDIAGDIRPQGDACDVGIFENPDGLSVTLYVENMVEDSVMTLEETDGTVIISPVRVGSTGIVTDTYSYSADTQVVLKVRKSSEGTKYLPFKTIGTITSTGLSVYVSQTEDTVAT